MTAARWLLCKTLLALLLVSARPALAQEIFAPGPLSNAHAALEGSSQCLKCHTAGMGITQQTCLSCHKDVRRDMDDKHGLHGHLPAGKSACETCHQEHLGRNNNLLPWRTNRSDFDHRLTGWPLEGKHARVLCDNCHTRRRASDNATIFRGQSTACASCHFDEHRGQESTRCELCHTTQTFRPATLFEHELSNYELTGKHRRVKCKACHPSVRDNSTDAHAHPPPMAPKSMQFTQFRNIAHGECTDCHRDPHKNKFGPQCTACHTTDSWNVVVGNKVKDVSFHEETRFPLRGAHVSVFCKNCHGPFGDKPAQFTGLRFEACEDCHVDAHEGQLPKSKGHNAPACGDCHNVQSFVPASFDAQAHGRTRYPLEGAHAAVPCHECHREDPALLDRVPLDVKARVRNQSRPLLVSDTTLDFKRPLGRCDSCHQSPHGGQFSQRTEANGCADCHTVSSFHTVRFDHDKESRFPLTGAHDKTACSSCHTTQEIPGGGVVGVLYKPMSIQCGSCHRDVHAGQMRDPKTGISACQKCHTTTAFKPASNFNHNDPAQSAFALTGQHASMGCEKCHTDVKAGARDPVRRYKPLPTSCDGCHDDFHKGALSTVPATSESPDDGSLAHENDADSARNANAQEPARTTCNHCHTTQSWLNAVYAEHASTQFPLTGQHRTTACTQCHTRDFATSISPRCDSCHRDAHAGELGLQCASCHNPENWDAAFDAQAHRLTVFPLRGAHGAIPCQECHIGNFSNNFRGTAASCEGCHASDYLRAGLSSINHVASNFSTNCRECHDPWAFQRGRLADHDTCFPVNSGAHAVVFCADCHTSLVGAVDNGQCKTGTFNCTGCHTHNQASTDTIHTSIQNYVYNNSNCYACHQNGM